MNYNYRYRFYTRANSSCNWYYFRSYSSISYGLKVIKKFLIDKSFKSCEVMVKRDENHKKFFFLEV